jgi:hypothetical protein
MSYDPYMALAIYRAFGETPSARGADRTARVVLRDRTNQSAKWSWILNRSREEHDANFAYIYANALVAR